MQKSDRTTLDEGRAFARVSVQMDQWFCGSLTTTASVVSYKQPPIDPYLALDQNYQSVLPTQRGRVATPFNYVRCSRMSDALSLVSHCANRGRRVSLVDAFGRLIRKSPPLRPNANCRHLIAALPFPKADKRFVGGKNDGHIPGARMVACSGWKVVPPGNTIRRSSTPEIELSGIALPQLWKCQSRRQSIL